MATCGLTLEQAGAFLLIVLGIVVLIGATFAIPVLAIRLAAR